MKAMLPVLLAGCAMGVVTAFPTMARAADGTATPSDGTLPAPAAPAPASAPAPAPAASTPAASTPAASTPPAPATATETVIAARYGLDRYDPLMTDSPFAPATPPEKPKVEESNTFQNYFLGSAAKMREGGVEKEWIILRNRSEAGSLLQLIANEPKDDFTLLRVEWNDDPKLIQAHVRKGSETGVIKGDPGAWGSSGGGAPGVLPGGARPPVPGAPRPGATPPRPGVNGVPLPNAAGAIRQPPAARGPNIPRPTNAVPLPGQSTAPGQADPRKRVRVINSK